MDNSRRGARRVLEPGILPYALKRVLLGKPLITAQLRRQRLSKKTALGVLSPDAISSSAYGPEQILVGLLPAAGVAAFTLALPITGAILLILILVAASYRQVVMAYTRAGGSYVVARENLGPRVAQIAAAALLIDYVVTVAVQASAGTIAVVSAIPMLGRYSLEITVGVVGMLCYLNLRGLREAGRPFAVPTYLFIGLIMTMIVVGLIKACTVGLPTYDPTDLHGAVPIHQGSGLIAGATVLVLLRSFANGGSSLTGVEAVSNTVSVFQDPRGQNAQRVLVAMAGILGLMIAGISILAYLTHATPYTTGYPSVVSQEAQAVFGHGSSGQLMFILIQAASALILYTGANTSFNGFPYLASFVAADRFLPRQLTKRGHRLVFSNGIIMLTVLAVALLIFSGGTITALVPFYAIGVFTGFAMAGYGMTKHHLRIREAGWRPKFAINLAAAVLSTLVVGIFAVAKFSEGAWLVVLVFPLLVLVLIRLNREYRAEAAVLDELTENTTQVGGYSRRHVLVLVNNLDLAVIEALRYASGLRPDELTAVHFVVDVEAAQHLRDRWDMAGMGTALELVDAPDRRVPHAAYQLVASTIGDRADTSVTVLLPRRSYPPLFGRLLHDRTADHIAHVISRIPHAAATIIPYDVQSRIRTALPEPTLSVHVKKLVSRLGRTAVNHEPSRPESGVTLIADLAPARRASVVGRLRELTLAPRSGGPRTVIMTAELVDATGMVILEFHASCPDLEVGQLLRVAGTPYADRPGGVLIISNPEYRIIGTETSPGEPGDDNSSGSSSVTSE